MSVACPLNKHTYPYINKHKATSPRRQVETIPVSDRDVYCLYCLLLFRQWLTSGLSVQVRLQMTFKRAKITVPKKRMACNNTIRRERKRDKRSSQRRTIVMLLPESGTVKLNRGNAGGNWNVKCCYLKGQSMQWKSLIVVIYNNENVDILILMH